MRWEGPGHKSTSTLCDNRGNAPWEEVQDITQRGDGSTSLLVLPRVAVAFVPNLSLQGLLLSLSLYLSFPGGEHKEPPPVMPRAGLQEPAFLGVLCDPGTHTMDFY